MGDKLAIPSDRKVAKKDEVEAHGTLARFIGTGGVWKGADEDVFVLEQVDDVTVCADTGWHQFRVEAGDGYFQEATGALPGGVPTAEPTAGAEGEKDADRPEDGLHGVNLPQALLGEPGEFAGTLPEVRPDLQGQPSKDRPKPEKYSESANLAADGKTAKKDEKKTPAKKAASK